MITEYTIGEGEDGVTVAVIRSKRKSMGLEINIYGEVKARVPARVSDKTIRRFLEEHESWIRRKLSALKDGQGKLEQVVLRPHELPLKKQKEFREWLCAKVEEYAQSMGVTYGKITLRFQKRRWGSCSSDGNLSFNYALAQVPENLTDYVIIHELAHRKHMNHSAVFWKEVEKNLPEYRKCREQLRKYRIDVGGM